MTITILDIQKRLKLLPESSVMGKHYQYYLKKADEAIHSNNPTKIIRMIETCVNDQSNSIHISTVTELFDALIECGTYGNVVQYGNLISEKYTAKVRDAKDTQTYLKQKLGRMKSKYTTKIKNNYEDLTDEIYAKLHKAQNNLKSNMSKISNNISNGLGKKNIQSDAAKEAEAKQEAAIVAYEKMINECTKIIYCDRILENYNRVSKRFNIDRLIQENIYANGIEDTINEICHLIETYDVPDKVKFNTALECAWYGFNRNYIRFTDSQLVTTVTDYYLSKGNNREACSKLLEASMIVKKDDYKGDLEVIQEEEPEEGSTNLDESMLQDEIRSFVVGYSGSNISLNEATSFNDIFEKFKSSDDTNKETKLQWLVRKLYSKNVDDIIEGTPTLFNYIRIFFILGSCAIHPVLMAVYGIADVFIALHTQRTETQKMIKCFDNEIVNTDKKLKTTNNNEEKDRLKKYRKELVKGKEKLEEYYDEMLTDKEMDAKYDEDSDSVDTFKDIIADDDEDYSDDDFNFDDDFDDFNEAVKFIPVMAKLTEDFSNLPISSIESEDIENILDTAPTMVREFVNISIWRPDIINPEVLDGAIANRLSKLRKSESTDIGKYNEMSMLSDCSYKLRTNQKANPNNINTIYEASFNLAITNEILSTIYSVKNACDYYHPLIEGSFTNSITLASEKLKKTIQKMSDKEKRISKNIDIAANNTKKAVEKSLTTDNREAIIKGSILPSASKTIKLGITSAGLYLIDPVLAVIGVIGYLGVSKKFKAKERQMMIDELEIEMKMCEKYIDIAESKNDMKALKQLMTIQRELERQHQRLKYKMKVDFGQKYYDTKSTPSYKTNED